CERGARTLGALAVAARGRARPRRDARSRAHDSGSLSRSIARRARSARAQKGRAVKVLTARAAALRLALLAALVLASIALGLVAGPSSLSPGAALRALWSDHGGVAADIALRVRLPRVVLAAVVGAALAVAGALFQALLRNPLADPYVLGVSGGAAVGGIL